MFYGSQSHPIACEHALYDLLTLASNYETTISYFQKFVNPQFLGIDFFGKSCNTIRQKAKALWITLSKVPFHIL